MVIRLGAFSGLVLFALAGIGCVRRDGRNADCRWPGEVSSRFAAGRHLSGDAEYAEDLAIRYADTHYGLRTPGYVSGAVYEGARDRCMAALFQQIAKEHGVPAARVSGALGRNRGYIDLAMNVPFLLLYCFAAAVVARLVWRRYPPGEEGWIPGIVMAGFLSLAMGAGGTMLGEVWFSLLETCRVGNGHMSYRVQRFWWVRHRAGLFAAAAVVFWVVAWAAARRTQGRKNAAALSG